MSQVAREIEKVYTPREYFDELVQRERDQSYKYRDKTVYGDAKRPPAPNPQLKTVGRWPEVI